MKQENKHWLQEVGTREGSQIVYRRAYVPSHLTDIRQTFARIQNELDESWLEQWKVEIEKLTPDSQP